ncbi:MAG: EamA family transporter RarD [Nocardioides sp.]|uniref:EamA family transporter RarD n=1 Tax=Nocardioides sp. TaxID=35761 RepID=UPI003F0E051B
MNNSPRGLGVAVAAYVMWGLFPLYWPLLQPAGALEILSHRVLWSAVTMLLVIRLVGRWAGVRAIFRDRRTLGFLTVGAALISVNWLVYIWGVNHDRVVEASLGYFINPLVTMLLGVLVLSERLRRWQWVALAIGFVAVVVLTLDYGRPPWVALTLAFTFGTYGLAKKQANTGAMESLTVETLMLLPFAAGWIGYLVWAGDSHFGFSGEAHSWLFVVAGLVTAVPLVLFGAAATSVQLVVLGIVQYIAPVIQFAIGLLVFHEVMTPARWAGFAVVWLALTIFTVEAIAHRRSQLRLEPII